MDGKAEIGNFPVLFSFDDICRFDVPVEDIFGNQVFAALNDLLDNLCGFGLGYFSLFGKICEEITVRTVLGHNIAFGIGFKNIIAANDVWVVQCFQYLYLICQHLHI